MAHVIDYPANKVKPDELPEPGDQYEAYGLAHKIKLFMVCFVFPDRTMKMFPYDGISMGQFNPLGDDGDPNEESVITLHFTSKLPGMDAVIVIAGRNLFYMFEHLTQHRVHWLWALPEGRAAAAEAAPVIRSIEIKDATRRAALPSKPSA